MPSTGRGTKTESSTLSSGSEIRAGEVKAMRICTAESGGKTCIERESSGDLQRGSFQISRYTGGNLRGRMRNDWKAAGQIILRTPPESGLICILNSQDGEPSFYTEHWVESSE